MVKLFTVLICITGILFFGSCHLEQRALSDSAKSNVSNENVVILEKPNSIQMPSPVTYATFTGKYINYGFGYTVEIPDKLEGISSPPPMPQHGVIIKLSDVSQLSVDGNFNALDWNSLDDAYQQNIKEVEDNYAAVKFIDKKFISLNGKKAIDFSFSYQEKESGKTFFERSIINFRACPGEDIPIVYTINLKTVEQTRASSIELMDRLLTSWKFLPKCEQ